MRVMMVKTKGKKKIAAENKAEEIKTIEGMITGEVPIDGELDLAVSQLGGVGAITAKKLEEFGVTSLIYVCVRGSKELSEITGVAKVKTNVWVRSAQNILIENGMIRDPDKPVLELLAHQESLPVIATKAKLDELFRGGVRP